MLAQMQQDFQRWLTNTNVGELPATLASPRGLTIYQNNYRTQLVNVLRTSYPLLLARLGQEAFVEAAIHQIDHHPPSSWTLDAYGANFGDTLRALYPHNPDLRELAWIEWALSEAFVAPDADATALDQLAEVDWDTARLQLSPSLSEHRATTNAFAVWSALQDEAEPPEAEMLDAPAGLVVWRQGFSSHLKQVDAIELAALQSLRDDDHFGALCDALVEALGEEQGVSQAGSLLAAWIGAGIVVGLEHDG